MKKDLTSLLDLTHQDIKYLLDLSAQVKKDRLKSSTLLQGKTIGLVFQKPSNRTRVSFEVGISQLGGNCLYLGPEEINLGVRESVSDVAKTLTRYLDGIVARTNTHEDLLELTKHATIPIINGLSDLFHPCQALADIFSIQEKFKKIQGLRLTYIGDGNNVCHSLLLGCSKVGIHIHIATPKGYEPKKDIVKQAQSFGQGSGANITVCNLPEEAVQGAHVVYADVWVSMGQEKKNKKRLKDFDNFQINNKLLKSAAKNYIFMHCLPAHRGQEVTKEIIDGPHSIVFDQAENRLHMQKAILIFLFEQHK